MFEKLKSFFKFDEKDMDDCIKRVEKSEEMRKKIKEKKEYGITEEEFNKIVNDIKSEYKERFGTEWYRIASKYDETPRSELFRCCMYLEVDIYNNDREKNEHIIESYRWDYRDLIKYPVCFYMELKNVDKCCIDYAKSNNIKIELTERNVHWIKICGVPLIELALDLRGVWGDDMWRWIPEKFF